MGFVGFVRWASYTRDRAFARALGSCEAHQLAILGRYVAHFKNLDDPLHSPLNAVSDYKSFASQVLIRGYGEWSPWIESLRAGHTQALKIKRFEPTSGSTQARKWIPYTAEFLSELDRAASPWIWDLGRHFPLVRSGRHYWSLSWLPQNLRSQISSTDDADLFPWWKRALLKRSLAVGSEVAHLDSLEDSLDSTCVQLLAADDLSLVSVWSPTFWIQLINRMIHRQDILVHRLEHSKLASSKRVHCVRSALKSEDLDLIWPRLAVISCWTESSSAEWLPTLRSRFPKVAIQGKGVWATEGAISIPYEGHYPMALRSHFFEFRDLNSGKVFLAHELQTGQDVEVIMTAGNALMRYSLGDKLKVTGVLGSTPCFKFLGREHTVDLAGEKMDSASALALFEAIRSRWNVQCVSLLAKIPQQPSRPHYLLLIGAHASTGEIQAMAESFLKKFHHYRLCRELGQLDELRVAQYSDPVQRYYSIFSNQDFIQGQLKIEPLREWRE